MHNLYDQLGKELGAHTLQATGRVQASQAMNAETMYADLRFEPEAGGELERARLGLLGRLADRPCLIELFSQTPSAAKLRASIAKLHVYGEQRAREGAGEIEWWLWIISAGVPRSLLAGMAFRPMAGFPSGVYELAPLPVGLVVAGELAVERETLLVRIMAGGRLLPAATREVFALPAGAYERILAEPVLLKSYYDLNHDASREQQPDEQEFSMVMYKSLDDIRAEGRAEGRAEVLRGQLRRKFGEIPPELDARIATASATEVDHFAERLLFADSIAAVFADGS